MFGAFENRSDFQSCRSEQLILHHILSISDLDEQARGRADDGHEHAVPRAPLPLRTTAAAWDRRALHGLASQTQLDIGIHREQERDIWEPTR